MKSEARNLKHEVMKKLDELEKGRSLMSQRIMVTAPGRLVADPEFGSENAPAVFRIACNNSVKGADGQWVEKPTYLRCKDWNHERSKKLTKGCLVSISGELMVDQRPEDKGGGYYPPEVKIYNVDILQWAQDKTAAEGGSAASARKEGAKSKRASEPNPFA